ncbi:hypothetical protein QR90_01015 [Deinococcus radiopugnans]|uniref:DUF2239 domain-containing protein n=1 Tax=Deinococcus radiopugnans TaxID=57497 RepID=A0A0A7KD29_9DEIO|nr:DUF2239 family protein [Deinococcus radiopugnans]AIZ44010.1 hypothetical protein QR90_01015 [Deinococcus radiopugnans]
MSDPHTLTVFQDYERLLTAPLPEVLTLLKTRERGAAPPPLTFDDQTGRQTDFDLRGTLDDVLERYAPAPAKTGPGRPKLGVVAREVTLLPRHWEWLEGQRGGASAALRRLIDEARKADPDGERRRAAMAATDRFLGVIAGDLPGYEEAGRALYAGNGEAFEAQLQGWPEDIRSHALYLAAPVFAENP